jgi:serine/threonine-protein kinase
MIGKVVGNYRITEKIGEGGMGAVYRGIDIMLEREVAIKVLRPELASQPEVLERFRAEAITLARLNHPNIATLYSFLREGDQFFMVMEFVGGKTIDEVIRESGPMSWNRAVALLGQALEGIDHAHRMGIVHRDIKPANLMLTESGSIKVMDFGIARALGTARMTRIGNVVGTLEYISPEQVRGIETDARSDIYSLGVLLYEMLTGRLPFVSDNDYELMRAQIEDAPPPPRTFAPQIPLPVEQAIMRSLAKKREARYQTAGEFRAVLLGALGAATNPLANAPVSYAAPATRILESAAPARHGGEVPARTLGGQGDERTRESFAAPARTTGSNDRDTRIDLAGAMAQASSGDLATGAEPVRRRTTGLSKLNRKHYLAGGVLLVVLAGVPFALMRSGTAPALPAAAPVESPAAEAAQPAEPAAAPEADPNAAEAAPAEEQIPEEAAAENSNASRVRTGARANRNEAVGETPAAELPVAPQTGASELPTLPAQTPEQTAPAAQQTAQQNQQQNPAAANSNAGAKKQQKKGGFGGLMRKIFGGDEKDKKPQKKEEKKP